MIKIKNIEYDSSRPLRRLEKGDEAIIKVKRYKNSDNRFKDVPAGEYKAICIKPFYLECSQYPVLSGSYNYWYGDKWGSSRIASVAIYADETNK